MLVEGCKHEVEITVPADELAKETELLLARIQKTVKMAGFRPGKAPTSLIRVKYAKELREDVLEHVLPKYVKKKVDEQELKPVSKFNVKDLHFEEGQPLSFKAEFEVAPQFELGEYRGVTVHYADPVVSDDDVNKKLEAIRDQKAQFINVEPRPAVDGDFAVVSLDSLEGADPAIHQDEMTLQVGNPETFPAFTEALTGMSPDEEKVFDVTYPEDYAQERLSGKTVKFRLKLKMIRTKELPELNDEFAQDLGDYQSVDGLRDAVKQSIFQERAYEAQQQAKEELIDELVKAHDFAVPEAYVEQQIENQITNQFRDLAERGIDARKLKLDWAKIKESQRGKALHAVKASLLVDKIADRESIGTTQDELDREVQRIAKQEREPVAALRKRLEKEGLLANIARQIRTGKTLAMLFEHARKVAEPRPAPEAVTTVEAEPQP
jgi:trigger factor